MGLGDDGTTICPIRKILANPKEVVVTHLLPVLKLDNVLHQIDVKNKTILSEIRHLTK